MLSKPSILTLKFEYCLHTIMSCILQSVLGQLTIQSQKVKRSIANINFVMNTVSMEMATELKERLTWINQHWEPLAGRVRHRLAQMKFEKAEKVRNFLSVAFLYLTFLHLSILCLRCNSRLLKITGKLLVDYW